MKKKIVLVCTAAMATFMVSACGSGSVTNEFMNELEKSVEHNTSYIKEEQTSSQISMEASVDGSEKENIVTVLSNANIMNKPSDDATVVGEVKRNESVLVIGENNVGGWYKVAYNGRVCYVKGASIDTQTLVADNGENDRTTSTTPVESSSTTQNTSEQQTTSTNTGESTSSVSGGETSSEDTTTPSGGVGGENTSSGENTSGNDESTDSSESGGESGSEGGSQDSSETSTPKENESSDTSETSTPKENESSESSETSTSREDESSSSSEAATSSEESTTPEEQTTSQSHSDRPALPWQNDRPY